MLVHYMQKKNMHLASLFYLNILWLQRVKFQVGSDVNVYFAGRAFNTLW